MNIQEIRAAKAKARQMKRSSEAGDVETSKSYGEELAVLMEAGTRGRVIKDAKTSKKLGKAADKSAALRALQQDEVLPLMCYDVDNEDYAPNLVAEGLQRGALYASTSGNGGLFVALDGYKPISVPYSSEGYKKFAKAEGYIKDTSRKAAVKRSIEMDVDEPVSDSGFLGDLKDFKWEVDLYEIRAERDQERSEVTDGQEPMSAGDIKIRAFIRAL